MPLLLLFVLVLYQWLIYVEEQRPYCEPNFTNSWWSVLLLHFAAYLLPACIKSFICYQILIIQQHHYG